jgi:hypothetical protein
MTPLRPVWPAGLPSPEALKMATEALGQHYVLPETLREPVVVAEAIQLAYLLSAYGLVPTQPRPAAAQSDVARDDARNLSRTKARFDRPRCAHRHGGHALVDDHASAMELAGA